MLDLFILSFLIRAQRNKHAKSAPALIELKLISLVGTLEIKLPQKLVLKLHFLEVYEGRKRNKKSGFS